MVTNNDDDQMKRNHLTTEEWAGHMRQTIRRREYYGSEYPRRSFFSRNRAAIISLSAGFIAIATFMAVLTIGLLLLPEACFVEMQRQVAVIEKNIGGVK